MTVWRAAGITVGFLADLLLADPRRCHPVAGFGRLASAGERISYRDNRVAGVAHTGVLVAGAALAGSLAQRRAGRAGVMAAATAAATWVALGGTTLLRTASEMADLLDAGDVDTGRRLLPSLCGRDPEFLDAAGLVRATCESVAENTSDAAVQYRNVIKEMDLVQLDYQCRACNERHVEWADRCSACNEWNTIEVNFREEIPLEELGLAPAPIYTARS